MSQISNTTYEYKPIIDLNHRHFRHTRGDIEVFGAWYGDRHEPCLALLPSRLIGQPDLNPCIVPLSAAWYYHEDNFDQPEMRERLTLMAKLLRLNPHSRSDRMAILRAIANHYDDLLNMPPRPKDGQRVVADAVTYDSETGTERSAEIVDYV